MSLGRRLLELKYKILKDLGLCVFGSEVELALTGVEGDRGGREEEGEGEKEGGECKRGFDEK